MDAVTPKGQETADKTADEHSHLVRPQEMEWQQTRFPGCEAKTLLFDRTTGLMTCPDAVSRRVRCCPTMSTSISSRAI